jgi:hypothetical protein
MILAGVGINDGEAALLQDGRAGGVIVHWSEETWTNFGEEVNEDIHEMRPIFNRRRRDVNSTEAYSSVSSVRPIIAQSQPDSNSNSVSPNGFLCCVLIICIQNLLIQF